MHELPGGHPADFDVDTCTLNRAAKGGDGYFFAEGESGTWVGPLGQLICERLSVRRDFDLVAIQEPNGSQAADMIMRSLPESRLIFLLRDGRDVVDSERAAYAEGGWMTKRYSLRGVTAEARQEFIEESAYKWVWRTQIVNEAFERHPGPKLLVRYEHLRENTEREMPGSSTGSGSRRTSPPSCRSIRSSRRRCAGRRSSPVLHPREAGART